MLVPTPEHKALSCVCSSKSCYSIRFLIFLRVVCQWPSSSAEGSLSSSISSIFVGSVSFWHLSSRPLGWWVLVVWIQMPRLGETQGSFKRGLMWSNDEDMAWICILLFSGLQVLMEGRERRRNQCVYTCTCASSVFSLNEFILRRHGHSQTPGSSAFHNGLNTSDCSGGLSTWLRLYQSVSLVLQYLISWANQLPVSLPLQHAEGHCWSTQPLWCKSVQ